MTRTCMLADFSAMLALACLLFTHPVAAQQSPAEVLETIVGIESAIPEGARTAPTLGTAREGSGVVIDDQGLVLTIGYLIMEASSVVITTHDGTRIDAEVVAYDHASGFGMLRPIEPMQLPHLEFGDSDQLKVGDATLVISTGGAGGIRPARVVSRRVFPGYWEYLLENAIFTAPPHPYFSGSALINVENKLLGIGSLIVSDAVAGDATPGNMFVPINLLKPILNDLLDIGRARTPRRPWIGIYAEALRGHVFVSRLADDGPAMRQGVQPNDLILQVAGKPVDSLETFLRAVWGVGDAGVSIPMTILRGGEILEVEVRSTDRYQWLKLEPRQLTGIPAHLTAISRSI